MTNSVRDNQELLACCIEAAKAAGEHAVRHKPRRFEVNERFAHDVKLQLDRECQAQATSAIHRCYPDDPILGEEGTHAGTSGSIEWIIDPIDGTVNFFHGLSWWCSSVAVRVNGIIVAGAVYAPEVSMLFDACAHGPARLNGGVIQVSRVNRLADALMVTGSEKELRPDSPPLATAQSLAPFVQKIRILGAAALDICQVASGAVDVFYQNGLYIWDVAAAGLVVERAGGIYVHRPTTITGRYSCLACANEPLKSEVERVIGVG